MPNQLFSRDLKTETLDVSTVQNLVSVSITSGLFKASYEEIRSLPDGTILLGRKFTVDRSPADVDLSALIDQAASLAEQFRQEDEDNKSALDAAVAAEAERWSKLTPEEQKAEYDAALAARQAQIDADLAKNGRPDPNPTGVISVTPTPTPISLPPVG
jgi:hypothetical protein